MAATPQGTSGPLEATGRGHRSVNGPVLNTRVVAWLSQGVLAPKIRAFCSAAPADGGTGALYVLLHRIKR